MKPQLMMKNEAMKSRFNSRCTNGLVNVHSNRSPNSLHPSHSISNLSRVTKYSNQLQTPRIYEHEQLIYKP